MSIVAPQGFVANGIASGIKVSGDLDMAIVATDDGRPVSAAAVFTSNKAKAAPVQLSARHLAATGGHAAAVVLTSGNANAATGEVGARAAERISELAAVGLGAQVQEILLCQTGLIGIPLPMAPVENGIPKLVAGRDDSRSAADRAATAIMTTDTTRKEVMLQVGSASDGWNVAGMAKGAAMLAPNMATMLAVLTTDVAVDPATLRAVLRSAVEQTFNRISVDGCTSTNDTVVVLASGRAGPPKDDGVLEDALTRACRSLAEQMVADAEGGTRAMHVTVTGAASDDEAHVAARGVAESLLVKCSINGADPYWGRVVSELGSAGVAFELGASVAYGGIVVCRDGAPAAHDAPAVAAHVVGDLVEIRCDLGMGNGIGAVRGTDLGPGYLAENRGTS